MRRRLHALGNAIRRRVRGPHLWVWYDSRYRIALQAFESLTGFDSRRASFAVWTMLEFGIVGAEQIKRPRRASYRELGRVHTSRHLESLASAEALARVFAVSPDEVPVQSVVTTLRLACGATTDAARAALRTGIPQLNLLGGFHHAEPDRGGGFSFLNDIAVAVAALRADGVTGRIGVLDLDAHPPDGTSVCLASDPNVWLGSISGTDWGALPNVDETVLTGADDATYQAALDGLLARMPECALVFVVAGGDVLADDALGGLALTEDGALSRDLSVAVALADTPAVWLPAGGYGARAWRVLSQTAAAIELRRRWTIPTDYDPLRARFRAIAQEIAPESDDGFDTLDLAAALGMPSAGPRRLLGVYSEEWIEHALEQYGVLEHVRQLGYGPFRVVFSVDDGRERLRVYARARGVEHIVFETDLERRALGDRDVLYVHWLTLRHPLASFQPARPRLPNQEVPGLGLAKEAGELLLRMARRLHLSGVAFTPAAFHVAYVARRDFRFVDPEAQGRFEALIEALGDTPIAEATRGIDDGRVVRNGARYRWEAADMISVVDAPLEDAALVAAAREATTFDTSALRSPVREG